MRFPKALVSGLFVVLGAWFSPAVAQQSPQTAQTSATVSAPTPAPQPSAVPPTGNLWGGTVFSNHFFGGYVGALWALNETRNTWIDGPLLRFDGIAGRYTYNTTAFPNTRVPTYLADMMLGYRWKIGEGLLSGYVGPVWEENDNPDPSAAVRGGKGGVRGIVDYSATFSNAYQVYAQGAYSSPFQTYFAMARVGLRPFAKVWVGPETQFFSIRGPYREARLGGYLTVETGFGEITFNGGYAHPVSTSAGSSSADGYYAGIYLGYSLH